MSIDQIKKKAMILGANEFGTSDKTGKRFFVEYKGKKIHFGSDSRETFFDIKDKKKRTAWIKRHSRNIDKKTGKKFINIKTSPLFWSYKILWD